MTVYAKIRQVAHYTPSQIVHNDDLAEIMDTSDEWIATRTGIRQRHIVKNEQTSDLAARVAQSLLHKSHLSADELDFIIVATITPDTTMPSTANRVQAAIGAKNAFAYDVTAACSGFVFALSTAEKFIASGRYQRGIVIGAEVLSKIIDWSDRTTAVLFGDGAGGVLLEAADEPHFLLEQLRSDGFRGNSLTAGAVGLSSPFSDDETVESHLRMNGRAIFEFAVRDVTDSIAQLISDSDLDMQDIDYFLLHQANRRILEKMARKLEVNIAKFPANMMEYGNTSAASIPILLSECVEQGHIQLNGNQTVLLCGFGGGLTWGTLVIKL